MWEQISRLQTAGCCCSLLMHGSRPGAGRAGGLAASIQMGSLHDGVLLLGTVCMEKHHGIHCWLLGVIRDGEAASGRCPVPGASELKGGVPKKRMASSGRIYTFCIISSNGKPQCCQLFLCKQSQQSPAGSRELPLEDQVVALVAGCSAGDNFLLLMLVENIR